MQEQIGIQAQEIRIAESGKRSAPLVLPDFKNAHSQGAANEYAELKLLVKQQGLLDQQPAYYICKFLFTLSLLAVSATKK